MWRLVLDADRIGTRDEVAALRDLLQVTERMQL
jgi:hypothetical protein